MESRRRRWLMALVAVGAMSVQPAGALERSRAESNDDGVHAEITVGEDGEARVEGRGRGASDCDWRVEQFPFTGQDPPARYGTPPSPEHRLYLIFCGPDFVGHQWLGPRAPGVDTDA